MPTMRDDELLRYSRQILLPGFDVEGQEKLRAARVLVVGAGGLGSPVALYLAAAGVGRLVIVDHDHVELSNLQRQVAHGTADIGRPKAESAADACRALNPLVEVVPVVAMADAARLAQLLPGIDLVVDCCDNFATRDAVNRACHAARIPLVSGAAIRMEGQLVVFDFRAQRTPCYACLYGVEGNEDLACARNGVMAPLVGAIGSLQALAAIRLLAGYGDSGHGVLNVYDGMRNEWRRMQLRADPACPVCGTSR
jgi:adenylyltransferase/sulfurtransferase